MTPAEINQDPVQGEFFSREADLPGRLVREAIQNSLDARDGGKPVRVRFVFSGDQDALPLERAGRYLDGLEEHVRAVAETEAHGASGEAALGEPGAADDARACFERPMRYLVVEDFGTTGLKGDTRANSESEQGNDFWGFFRSVGISPKGEDDAGSWGLGKWVFPDASAINAYLGMTQRSGEEAWLLMGMAQLKTHSCGGHRYRYYGSFARESNADDQHWFPEPLDSRKDADFILQALQDFNLERMDDSGLSVVVPYPKRELDPEAIARSVLTQYFLPIARGDLEVEIVHPAQGHRTITKTNILEEAGCVGAPEGDEQSERPEESSDSLRRAIELAQWAVDLPEDEHVALDVPARGRWGTVAPRLVPLRERYEQGDRLAFRLTTKVRSKSRTVATSSFRVYLERADDLDEGRDYFVRGQLHIPQMDHIRQFKARALVLVDGKSELGHLLRDAEGPAHDRWDRNSERLKDRWKGGQDRVDEVRRAPAHLLQHLLQRSNERQLDALADLFPGDPTQIGKGGRGPGGEGPPPPLPPPPPGLQIESPPGAFVVRPAAAAAASGLAGRTWDVRFAYDTVRGNPFAAFARGDSGGTPDFSLLAPRTLAVAAEGCEYTATGKNALRVTATKSTFSLQVSGFDERDVKVDVQRREERPVAEHAESAAP